jgi:outer membrane protein assembly factor BamB
VAALAGTQASPRATVPAADWTTYHHDRFRTGDGSITGSFTSLHPRFVWHLPTPLPAERNDAMYASPLIDGDVAIVTTLQNRVFAVSTVTGKTLWARTLGAPYAQPGGACGDIGPTIGIVSTPIIDEGRNELFVVGAIGTGPGGHAQSHRLFGLSMTTGKVLYERSVDPPGQQLLFLLQRPALAITKGRVIVGFGGNDGDCGNYHGWVESIAESGTSRIDRYEVAAGSGQGKGAVWMGGAAPTIDKAGNVYVADGNGNATSSHDAYDHSDAVLKLTPSMQLLDWFAPTTWYSDNASDLDLGSGAPQLLGDGLILQVGKTETGYLLNPLHLGHIDGSVRTFSVCAGLGKSNGADALVGNLVVVPCDGGLDAVHVSTTAPYGTTKWTSVSAGSPVYAAGLVWAISGSTGGSTLYALNPSNGNAKLRYNFGAVLNHFATPSVGDNMVFVAAATTLLAFPPG